MSFLFFFYKWTVKKIPHRCAPKLYKYRFSWQLNIFKHYFLFSRNVQVKGAETAKVQECKKVISHWEPAVCLSAPHFLLCASERGVCPVQSPRNSPKLFCQANIHPVAFDLCFHYQLSHFPFLEQRFSNLRPHQNSFEGSPVRRSGIGPENLHLFLTSGVYLLTRDHSAENRWLEQPPTTHFSFSCLKTFVKLYLKSLPFW